MMVELSASQMKALRWIDDFPSTQAEWTVGGKHIKRETPDKWDAMRISGAEGSILIAAADLKALSPFITHCAAPHKLYSLNEKGRSTLTGDRR